ncbi:hypothetical protein [Escherichia coli]|uniref:hypothetical protein n=1 Tax=Escherichia coli TaxID=562 RepID=UPI0020232346|nr:hypothetical protein [Escherichia coli]
MARCRRYCRTSCWDELDKELEPTWTQLCRYADDCNIYVSSRKAGEHLLDEIRGLWRTN